MTQSSGRRNVDRVASTWRDQHEAFLVRTFLGPRVAMFHRVASEGVLRDRHEVAGGTADRDLVRAQKALLYFSAGARWGFGLAGPGLLLLVARARLWDTWLDEIALGLAELAALGMLVCAIRIGLVGLAKGRHARWLEPANSDLVWQGAVVASVVIWAT